MIDEILSASPFVRKKHISAVFFENALPAWLTSSGDGTVTVPHGYSGGVLLTTQASSGSKAIVESVGGITMNAALSKVRQLRANFYNCYVDTNVNGANGYLRMGFMTSSGKYVLFEATSAPKFMAENDTSGDVSWGTFDVTLPFDVEILLTRRNELVLAECRLEQDLAIIDDVDNIPGAGLKLYVELCTLDNAALNAHIDQIDLEIIMEY